MNFLRMNAMLWFAGLLLAIGGITGAEDIKQIHPTGYVTDLAGILRPETRTKLEAMCTELEQKTGAQMAIVTVKSLDGNQIQPYANDLFQKLGVGKKKEDTGVMLLIAPNDRKYWTEVGYGLEPVINDARAGDAGRLMVPYFRQGDYSNGVSAAAWQLAKYIADDKGVTLTGAPQLRAARHEPGEKASHFSTWLALAIIFAIFVLIPRGGSNNRGGGGGGSGVLTGLILGALASGGRGGGGWTSGSGGGSWGGGGWGGGSGGFGGFGGGSSGGGGAGGSW